MHSDNGVTVRQVDGDRDMEGFLRLPWSIQENDPCWVPPILSEQERFLDPRTGPFFEIGEAAYFLAFRDGMPVGRVSAHVNGQYERHQDAYTGFFGFFECVKDQHVADTLLEAAADWLRLKGKRRILGPLSFSIYDEVGLLVEGFDSLPAILQAHNPPYYEELLTNWGLRKAVDWYAFRVTNRDIDSGVMEKKLHGILSGHGLTLRSPHRSEFTRRAEEIVGIFNEAWSANWGHVPLTEGQFRQIFAMLEPIIRSDLVDLILDGDKIVAFMVSIPDLNPLIREMNGRLSLWHRIRLLCDVKFRKPRKIRTLILGVKREYQRKRLHHALILSTYLRIVRTNSRVEVCDCSLISEPLTHFIRMVESYGASRYKTFRIFERDLPA